MKPAERRIEQDEAHSRPAAPAPSRAPSRGDYQMELGGKSLLGLLFVAAVICAMFFALGYTIGKHSIPATFSLGSAPPSVAAQQPAPVSPGVKPPNPVELGAAESGQTPPNLAPSVTSSPEGSQPGAASQTANTANVAPDAPATPQPAPPVTPAAMQPTVAPQGQGIYQVQVFAGGEVDADSLASALKARGYPAMVVAPGPDSTDARFRVQVGPYLTIAEAQAMRSRLTADGYQAILKQQ